jgi:hypothetical protein
LNNNRASKVSRKKTTKMAKGTTDITDTRDVSEDILDITDTPDVATWNKKSTQFTSNSSKNVANKRQITKDDWRESTTKLPATALTTLGLRKRRRAHRKDASIIDPANVMDIDEVIHSEDILTDRADLLSSESDRSPQKDIED